MKYYIGLDVSMKDTFVCTINSDGDIISEFVVPTDPEMIASQIKQLELNVELVGLESGSLSHWLTEELACEGLPVKCIDARHCAAFLSMKINKTDRNDAQGIAEVMRCGLYREVQVKSRPIREAAALFTSRKQLVGQRTQTLMSVRGILKPFGVRLGSVPKTKSGLTSLLGQIQNFGLRPGVLFSVESLIRVALAITESISELDKKIKEVVLKEPKAQLLMTIPGVGPVTALKYLIEIGDPKRFKSSRAVGAYLGLTPKQYSSGETQKQGKISKCGSKDLRSLLVEAAIVILTRTKSWSKLKAWGVRLMGRMSLKKAATAVARKLGVIMHKMLLKDEPFRFSDKQVETLAA